MRRIFFWDNPAQGAFFGMTLLFSLPWFMLVWLCRNNRAIVSMYMKLAAGGQGESATFFFPVGIALLLALYSCFLFMRLLPKFWLLVKAKEFLPLLHGVCGVIALCGAVYVLMVLVVQFVRLMDSVVSYGSSPRAAHFAQSMGWGWFAFAGLVLAVAAYLLIGKLIAASEKMPFRGLCGKGVVALWLIILVSYVCCLALAFSAASNYNRSIDELAEYFGHPINAKGYAEVYYGGREPDADFWKRLVELNGWEEQYGRKGDSFNVTVDGKQFRMDSVHLMEAPSAFMEDCIYKEWKAFFRSNESIRRLEAMLDAPLPLAKREFSDDVSMAIMPLNEISCIRHLVRMECWRLRMAMEDGDFDDVKMAWRRMENVCDYMQNDAFLLSGLVWIAVEHLRLSSMERLIQWEKTETAWLEEQSEKLAELEGRAAHVQRRAVYGEAVCAVNGISQICTAYTDINGTPLLNLSALRWYFPQVWRGLAQDAAEAMKAYRISDFSDFPEKSTDHLLYNMVSGALRMAGTRKFPSLVAETRIMRSLIDVELQKRRTGRYPERFDTVEDPFSKQPLKYMAGKCELWITVLKYKEHNDDNLDEDEDDNSGHDDPPMLEYDFEKEKKTVDAVQIWSVGPDGIDDGGLSSMTDDKVRDDIRFIILTR